VTALRQSLLTLLALLSLALPLHAQPQAPPDSLPIPPTSQAVITTLEAEYLTDAERADRRIFHALWLPSDLNDPARRARAALICGAIDDPSLSDPAAAIEDRAEAQLLRGNPQAALDLLAHASSPRAARLRAESLESLGKPDDANKALEPAIVALDADKRDPAAITEGVRALMLRARLEGRPADDYNRMLQTLIGVQQDIDRLYWPALVAQAELLVDKDNPTDAAKALQDALTFNASAVEPWFLFGKMAVDSFNFQMADLIAAHLDNVARRFSDDPAITSPYADIVRARSWMRQNDPDFAEVHIERVLTRFPIHREALALHCAITAQRYDFDRLERQLTEFDALSPNSPLALFEAGAILSEMRQYARSADYLGRAAQRQPNWPAPFIELGLMEMQAGRDDQARAALTRAFELDPFNVRAKNSLTLVNELAIYERVETPHFVIRHKPGSDAVMARDMVEPLEEIHRIVAAAIEHEPAVKTTIDLMPDHQWFGVRITGMPAIHTIAAATGPVIAMEAPRVGARNNGEYDWVRVIQHEYTHTISLSRTGNRIPHWFTEAAAVYVENAPRDYPTCQLLLRALDTDTLFDLRQINVAFVRPEKPDDRAQAYAQGHWMYQYMVHHYGSSAPLRLMDEYAKGVREAAAMQSVLGVSQEQFMRDFTAWAREDVKQWGMLPSPSIKELLFEATIKDPINREALRVAVGEYAALGGWKLSTGSRLGAEWYELPFVQATPELVEFWSVTFPDHADVLELFLSDQLVLTDNKATPELVPLLERYAKARPVDPMPHRLLAKLYLAENKGAEAIPHLEYLDVREQYSPTYAVELAKRYSATGDLDRAWAKALRATRIAPYDPTHRELAAAVAIRRGDLAAAERQINALIELEPDQPKHKQRLEALRARMKSN